MKLLLDANLSHRMLDKLDRVFPSSAHVNRLGLETASDRELWDYAREHGFVLVSKDSDFHELATLYGPPPQIIWLKCGNRPRSYILDLLLRHHAEIIAFGADPDAGVAEIG